MSQYVKLDIPTLTKRIIEEAFLPKAEESMLYKFNRQQLVELYMYISELKKTNKELIEKINSMNQSTGDNGGKSV